VGAFILVKHVSNWQVWTTMISFCVIVLLFARVEQLWLLPPVRSFCLSVRCVDKNRLVANMASGGGGVQESLQQQQLRTHM
jgi:hypothetical protein